MLHGMGQYLATKVGFIKTEVASRRRRLRPHGCYLEQTLRDYGFEGLVTFPVHPAFLGGKEHVQLYASRKRLKR